MTARPILYSYCETLAYYRWHIRPLSSEGLKYGGGADTKTLCGMTASWDVVHSIPTASNVAIFSTDAHLCSKCAEAWRKLQEVK